jgi:ankyrin repeat protein
LWQTDLISIGGPRYLNKLSTWEWLSNIGVEFTSRSLGWAASHGCLNIIQFLLANGVELTEEVRREALDDAAISGSVETFKFLEGDGSVPKEEFTLLAVSSGSLELVKYLESSHLKYYVPQAISSGNLEMLKYLIEVGGAEPSLENLEHATRQGSLDLVRYLVEEGGINPDDYHELLLRVARGGKVEVLQYLLSRSKFPHIERIEEHLSQQRKVLESLKLIEKAMGLV